MKLLSLYSPISFRELRRSPWRADLIQRFVTLNLGSSDTTSSVKIGEEEAATGVALLLRDVLDEESVGVVLGWEDVSYDSVDSPCRS